jgi:hypothetical protein
MAEKKELRSGAISSSGSIRVMVITGAMDRLHDNTKMAVP